MDTALITGASRGLGLALARELARRSWRLVIDARGADALEAARAELAELTEVVAIPGDVADTEHLHNLVQAAGPRIDLLVNNASVLGPSPQPPLADYPLGALEHVYRVNVMAPLALFQLALPRLRPGACVLNVTSDAAVEPYEGWGGYGSSKAALEQLSRILGAEHPDLRILAVNALAALAGGSQHCRHVVADVRNGVRCVRDRDGSAADRDDTPAGERERGTTSPIRQPLRGRRWIDRAGDHPRDHRCGNRRCGQQAVTGG